MRDRQTGDGLHLSQSVPETEERMVSIMKMKVRKFIKQDIDIDVCDNVCEELGVSFVGPMYLTKEGEKRFAKVLDFDIDIDFENDVAIVDVDGADDVWEEQLEEAETFFNAMAGYCSVTDYGRWFEN